MSYFSPQNLKWMGNVATRTFAAHVYCQVQELAKIQEPMQEPGTAEAGVWLAGGVPAEAR